MHCQHSIVRIDPQFAAVDQQNLNILMRGRQVVTIKTALVPADPPYWSVLIFTDEARQPEERQPEPHRPAPPPPARPAETGEITEEHLTPAQHEIYEKLRAWRLRRADELGLPQYVVAHNKTLLHIAWRHTQLRSADDLLAVPQFGRRKADRYGAEILQILAAAHEDDLFGEG